MPERENVIAAHGLTANSESGSLLDDVTFEVGPAEILSLASPPASTAGVVGIFAGLVPVVAGEAVISGHDVAREPLAARQKATIITKRVGLYPSLTARQNIDFFVTSFRGRAATSTARDNAMRRVGVPEKDFSRTPARFGPDLALRLWFAIALLRETPALILEEPTHGLDARGAREVQEALRELRQDGRAVLVSTSDVGFAIDVADRIAVMKGGKKVLEKARQELTGSGLTDFYLEHVGQLPPRPELRSRP